METKKNVQPQQSNQNKKPDNMNNNSGKDSKNTKKDNQQDRQSASQNEQEDVEEKSFQRTPGGQANAQQGKRAILNEEQQDEVIDENEEVEE
jgi:hypothetical protein